MHDASIRVSLEAVGKLLGSGRDVEILVVGGAAGIMTGQLPPATTTGDVDVLKCHLPEDRDAVLEAAAAAGRELSLPASWMNEDVGLHRWTLLPGWESRRVFVGQYGRLRVFAIGRLDLIAMKFSAHRSSDLEQLNKMRVTAKELNFVRSGLEGLVSENPNELGTIELALSYVDGWVPHE